jgi:hypothetical protein
MTSHRITQEEATLLRALVTLTNQAHACQERNDMAGRTWILKDIHHMITTMPPALRKKLGLP